MRRSPTGRLAFLCAITVGLSTGAVALAEGDVAASKSLTIQASGPRQGAAGANYFNIQGKNKDRYAGFGILVFPMPKGDADDEIKQVTITLVQSIPSFASDGKIKFYVAQPPETGLGLLEKLKYDPTAPGGVAKDAFKSLHLLGTGTFKKVETGRLDTFVLEPDETAQKVLLASKKGGGLLHIVVVPEDDDVAATYFGAGNDTEAHRPRIKLGSETRR